MKSGSSKFRYRGIVIGCVCLTVFICGSKTAFGQTSSNLRTISTTYSLPLITSATLPSSHQSRLRSSPIYGTKLSPTVTLDMGQDHQLDSTPTSSSFSLSGLSLLSATSTTSSISAPTSLVPAAYSLPQPFDETLAASFSTSCLSFFYTFLADPSLYVCLNQIYDLSLTDYLLLIVKLVFHYLYFSRALKDFLMLKSHRTLYYLTFYQLDVQLLQRVLH